MLGWVLKRSLDSASDAPAVSPGESSATKDPRRVANKMKDDTQFEQPDTPAPVFAARAFKTALFGTPARVDRAPLPAVNTVAVTKDICGDDKEPKSPAKPPGILLTPGTATARRKRVSFGHDVRDNASKPETTAGRPDDKWASGENDGFTKRVRTKLTEALENSRRRGKAATEDVHTSVPVADKDDEEGVWEEVDDLDRDPDVTVDLNEPHSRSGKYWKAEFKRYQEDAKLEMAKLLKYKQMAKSFAQMKDAESVDLHAKLKEEQARVAQMESRISELAGQMVRRRMKGTDRDNQEMIRDLTRQTALAVQYRNQVKELEAILKSQEPQHSDDISRLQGQGTSPRTHRTLLETQRELRRAREQAKELADLKEEARRLRSSLRSAEHREARAKSRIESLEERVKTAEEETRLKENELHDLRREYDTLKASAKARVGEAEQVLRRKNEMISDLRRNNRSSASVDLGSSKSQPEPVGSESRNSWNGGLAELQAKLDASQKRQARDHEDGPQRADHVSRRRSSDVLKGRDVRVPRSIDILEDDTTELPLPTLKKRPDALDKPTDTSRSEKESSSAVLSDRTNRDNTAAERRSSSSLSRRASSREIRHAEPPQDAKNVSRGLSRRPVSLEVKRSLTEWEMPDRATPSMETHQTSRPSSSDSGMPKIDLVQGRFARLGGPDINSSAAWTETTSRSTLPPDRRAAALARLEQKRAQRNRVTQNKENMRP